MLRTPGTGRSFTARLMAAVMLAAFLVASTGYPVWSAVQPKDLSQPFPCMHRKCGCRNAEQCWRGCCCFTNQQKLAWARQHKVTTPEYVAAAASKEKWGRLPACHKTTAQKTASCCSKKVKAGWKPAPLKKPVFEPLSCQGYAEQWVAIGAIHVVPPEMWQVDLPCTGTVLLISEARDSTAIAPPSPPPWC